MSAATAPRLAPPGAAGVRRSLHVVQVSRDQRLLDPVRGGEPWSRQQDYAAELERQSPGSRMSILVLTSERRRVERRAGGLRVRAVTDRAGGLVRLLGALRRLHREDPIDVLTTQSPFEELWIGLLFAGFASIRVVGQIHFDPFSPAFTQGHFALLRRLRLRLALASLRWVHSLRVVSSGVERGIAERRLHGRVSVVPVPAGIRGKVHTGPEKPLAPTILYVGRLAPEKGLSEWLGVAARVARAVPEVRFVWVGEGPSEAALHTEARALGLGERLRFAGYRPSEQLAGFYRSATALLLTSHHEGFGRVLLEAARCGIPSVATRTSGAQDLVVAGETGFLHAQDDLDGMAASLVRLIREPHLRARLGRAAAARARRELEPAELSRAWVAMLVAAARDPLGPVATPRLRSFARWRRLAFAKGSLLRLLEEEATRGLTVAGRVLDLGGGARASYLRLLRVAPGARIESVNLDPRTGPTHRLDLEEPLPFRDGEIDQVISLNTFEHLERDEQAVAEALRVLRPGGRFQIVVPFLYRVHGSPHDFHRHTPQWWARILEQHGAEAGSLCIEPLVWDRLASASSFFSGPLSRLLRPLVLLPAVLADLRFARSYHHAGRRPDRGSTRRLIEVALGWSISGVKQEEAP